GGLDVALELALVDPTEPADPADPADPGDRAGPEAPPLPAAVEVAAYRIVGEALTNVVRHAGTDRCDVVVRRNGGLELVIADHGRGLGADATAGVGMRSMRERAAELGGTLDVATRAGGGTT